MKKGSSVRRCRLCASEDILNNFNYIFDDNSELKLEMKIRKLLPVVVLAWDPMPHVVCHDCTDKLNTFSEFYEASLRTERLLRTLHSETPASPEREKGPENREAVPGLLISSVGELETKKKECLPPLKIRLYAVRSGLFVCCLCEKRFEDKGELKKHIKGHFLEGSSEEEKGATTEGEKRRLGSLPERAKTRGRERGLWTQKKRRVMRRRSLEYQTEESSNQEKKICPESSSSAKETTEDDTETSTRDTKWDGKPQKGTEKDAEDSEPVTEESGEMDIPTSDDDVTVIQIVHNNLPMTLSSCVFCDKLFATRDSLLEHKSKHLKEFRSKSEQAGPYLCEACPRTFPSEEALGEHLRCHKWDLNWQRGYVSPLKGFSPGGTKSSNWWSVSEEEEVP